MLEIEIDGKQVQVADGATVMDAAAKAGVYIPHFCYHKKLSIAANCRMCLVQVEKAPKPLPACATPVTAGMKVWTHSELAVKAQKGVMEFLLINHPLDCPICDQGGECQLQDIAVGYGGTRSRYQEEKRVVADKNLGPLVETDMTRCINCTRCVRFTQEIAGRMELGQAFRGEHAEIMPFLERTLDTELSGNVIDLCPVGALTSKPFRYSARTWELSRRRSVSPHDSLGSNLIVQVKHDRVKRVLPLENEALNECWISDKDRFSYLALNSEDRLEKPMKKQAGGWVPCDWQEALEMLASKLKEAAAADASRSVAAWASPHSTFEELYLLQKLVRALGSEQIESRLRRSDFRNDAHRRGAPWLGMKVAEVGELDRLLVVGSFLRKDAPLLAQRVRQAAKKGLKVNVIGSVAEDWQLTIHNRATVAPLAITHFLAQVLKAVCELKGVSSDLAADNANDAAQSIARSLASGRKVAIWLGNAAEQHAQADDIARLAAEIAQLLDARFGFIGEAANSVGAHLAKAVSQVREQSPQTAAVQLLWNAEPSFDFADAAAIRTALQSAQFRVMCSPFRPQLDADLELFDLLLPIAPFTETSGTFINCEATAQSFHAVCKPFADTRPGWKVLRVLGNLLHLAGFEQNDSQAVRDEALAESPIAESLDNSIGELPAAAAIAVDPNAVQRIADIPIYFADPLARRSAALQATQDAQAPRLRLSAATAAKLGLADGGRARVRDGAATVELDVVVDDRVADGCVWMSAAHASTAAIKLTALGLSVERI